jgi:hypothetical protein
VPFSVAVFATVWSHGRDTSGAVPDTELSAIVALRLRS